MAYPTLKIGKHQPRYPLVQGGMGVKISGPRLAGAVAQIRLAPLAALLHHPSAIGLSCPAFRWAEKSQNAVPVLPVVFDPVHDHAMSAPGIGVEFFHI